MVVAGWTGRGMPGIWCIWPGRPVVFKCCATIGGLTGVASDGRGGPCTPAAVAGTANAGMCRAKGRNAGTVPWAGIITDGIWEYIAPNVWGRKWPVGLSEGRLAGAMGRLCDDF